MFQNTVDSIKLLITHVGQSGTGSRNVRIMCSVGKMSAIIQLGQKGRMSENISMRQIFADCFGPEKRSSVEATAR